MPQIPNIPLLRAQTDATISLAAGEGRAEVQVSYAFTNELGVLFGGAFYRPEDDEDGDGGTGNFAEGGVGYFASIGSPWTFEAYGLLGVGDLENHFPSTVSSNPGTTGTIESGVLRVGVQSAFSIRLRYVEAAFSVRVMSLNYRNVSGSLIFAGEDQVSLLRQNSSYVLLEPALTLRAGAEFLKMQLQTGLSANLTDSDFDQDTGHLTVGIVYYPSRHFRPRN